MNFTYLPFSYYLSQKKTLEINPRHPLIKELLRRVEASPEDALTKDMALMMFQTGKYEIQVLFYRDFALCIFILF